MMERPGRVLTRERLLERVWGHHDTDWTRAASTRTSAGCG